MQVLDFVLQRLHQLIHSLAVILYFISKAFKNYKSTVSANVIISVYELDRFIGANSNMPKMRKVHISIICDISQTKRAIPGDLWATRP